MRTGWAAVVGGIAVPAPFDLTDRSNFRHFAEETSGCNPLPSM